MELLSQLDGFEAVGKVKMIMATNRPDVLDPALMRPGRLDRKIEIPLPNEQVRAFEMWRSGCRMSVMLMPPSILMAGGGVPSTWA